MQKEAFFFEQNIFSLHKIDFKYQGKDVFINVYEFCTNRDR